MDDMNLSMLMSKQFSCQMREHSLNFSGIRSVRNVSAVEGKTATLSCTVRNLGDRRVSKLYLCICICVFVFVLEGEQAVFVYLYLCLYLFWRVSRLYLCICICICLGG